MMLGDPHPGPALQLLDAMEKDGWRVTLAKYMHDRAIGVFQLARTECGDVAERPNASTSFKSSGTLFIARLHL